jgi:hypothetical protein
MDIQDYYILLFTFGLMIFAATIGALVRRKINPNILDEPTRELARIGVALVVTLSSIVLGLLLSSSFGRFEARKSDVRQIAAQLSVLDMMLKEYGAEGGELRKTMRTTVDDLALVLWHPLINESGNEELQRANEGLASLYRNVLDLQVTTQRQSVLKNSIVNVVNEIAQKKRILESSDRDTTGFALLAICLFWYFINFMTYFLFAPVTRVSVAILGICAFSVSLAFFVIFEHEVFGSGLISIPREHLTSALPPLTKQ